jgi:asparagine synthase (glutamine-hydrolysing)
LPRVAIGTSGGYDSSAVAATAARLGHADLTCYACVPPDGFELAVKPSRYLSERPKVEALARMHPSLNIRYLAPDAPHALQDDATAMFVRAAMPLRNIGNMAWFAALNDRVSADRHRVLLHGTMGNFGLTWGGAFSLAELLRAGRFGDLLREGGAIARKGRQSLLRILAREAIMPILPRAIQRLHIRVRGGDPDDVGRFSLIRPEAVETFNLRRLWEEDGFDPHYRYFGRSPAFRALHLFDQNQIARDLRAMYCDAQSLEMRDPYADRELLEFCLAVPEWLYRRDGVPRAFARAVFADRLPAEILEETRRGIQVPNWFAMLDARKPMIEAEVARIEGSALARRLIDLPRLKRLLSEWPKDAQQAEAKFNVHRVALGRAVHLGQFIRWVEGGNG